MLLVGNLKAFSSSILSLQHTTFLHGIKHCGCKIGIKFDKGPLVVEQNNYVTKIVNTYMVYDYILGEITLLETLH